MGETNKTKDDPNRPVERANWGSPVEFVLSCLGYAVGLGNIWRFPYMTFINGGGAFLIPYVICYIFVGLPIFLMELIIGQFSGGGPVTIWEVAPLFKGLGYTMIIRSFIGSISYNLIIAWSIYYIFASFTKHLPWQSCSNDYNTEYCYSGKEAEGCTKDNGTWFNQTCYNETHISSYESNDLWCNSTLCVNMSSNPLKEWLRNSSQDTISAAEEYFNLKVLDRSPSIEEMGGIKWELALVLLLSWFICFLCILKGIRSSGKVVYFTALFPYVLLFILFVRALMLPNALKGILFYVTPEWSRLTSPQVWVDAAGQIFFSLSIGGGGLMTLASYNKFRNNVFRDTLIVSIGDSLTSFWAGFIIFSILGFIASELRKEIKDVATSGSGLVFITYPDVVTRLPVPQMWAFLFFFMVLNLGLDSQFANLENMQTALVDTFPKLRKYHVLVSGTMCSILFLLGLPLCTRAGIYWLELLSYYNAGWGTVVMALFELVVFSWLYGADKLINNAEEMMGFRLSGYWWFMWKFVAPPGLLVILVANLVKFQPLAIGGKYLPQWAAGIGLTLGLFQLALVPLVSIVIFCRSAKDEKYASLSAFQRFKKLCQPTELWRQRADLYVEEEVPVNASLNMAPPEYNGETPDDPNAFDNRAFKMDQTDKGNSSVFQTKL